MNRLLRYTVILVALTLWIGGCYHNVTVWLTDIGVVRDDYRYGDLYRLANLSQFRDPQAPCNSPDRANPQSDTHLYIIGDSFTEPSRIGARDFPVSRYHYTHWEAPNRVQLDPSKRSVLLIESVERHFREHLSKPVNQLSVVADTTRPLPTVDTPLWRAVLDRFRSEAVEPVLETVLFSHDPFMWLKEVKADLTLRLFDRTHPRVALSTDRQHLLYNLDVDKAEIHSSFNPVPAVEINRLVDSLNAVRDRYRRLGFAEVYLSIIPNKTSIVDPTWAQYNHLIERVQGHPKLRVPVVDVYSRYVEQPDAVYALGDSHWSCIGRARWLDEVDRVVFRAASPASGVLSR